MVNMRVAIICFSALLLVGVLVLTLSAQTERNYCPLEPEEQAVITSPPPGGPVILTKEKLYTVPRKQVLIEAFTRTG
jgi:hypothetical protein